MTKEQEILLAAEEEFFHKGYDAASTASIAKTAGVTHAMVNYYFRSKENLFFKILDNHINAFMASLKPLMEKEGDYVAVLTNIALAVFDRMNGNRRLPFLLNDISRNHPDFLLRYKDIFMTVCMDSVKRHAERFEKAIAKGQLQSSSIHDIFDTILTLSCTPFLNLSFLVNIACIPDERIDAYLASRREEIRRIIEARYRIIPQVQSPAGAARG